VYWDRCTLFDVTFEPKQMSVEQLEHGFRGLMAKLYAPGETAHRKRRMRHHLKDARS
jgi:hypothetical protein